jgi:hypothetical protein
MSILISGFRRDLDVICGLLGNYTASCGNYLPTFRDNVSVPSSSYWLLSHRTVTYPALLPSFLVTGFLSFLEYWPMKMGPTRCPETSVNNYHTTPCNYPKDHRLQYPLVCLCSMELLWDTWSCCCLNLSHVSSVCSPFWRQYINSEADKNHRQ